MSLLENQTYNLTPDISNYNVQTLDNIKNTKSQKEQLKKASSEFEAVFVTKMLNMMDKTVDKEGGIFGNENKYLDKFKNYMYTEMGRQIATNPTTSIGFAKQIYSQMEKLLPKEGEVIKNTGTGIKVDKEI